MACRSRLCVCLMMRCPTPTALNPAPHPRNPVEGGLASVAPAARILTFPLTVYSTPPHPVSRGRAGGPPPATKQRRQNLTSGPYAAGPTLHYRHNPCSLGPPTACSPLRATTCGPSYRPSPVRRRSLITTHRTNGMGDKLMRACASQRRLHSLPPRADAHPRNQRWTPPQRRHHGIRIRGCSCLHRCAMFLNRPI